MTEKNNAAVEKEKKMEEKTEEAAPKLTLKQKLNRKKIRAMRKGYKFLTRKVVFPLVYAVEARKPLVDNKVVFVEDRRAELDSNATMIYNRLVEEGGYDIHKHFFRIDFCRYRQEFKNSVNFVKDVATANYVVMTDSNGPYSSAHRRKGTYALQLWHGCGAFKKFGFSTATMKFGGDLRSKRLYPSYLNLDLVTVSSPEVVWAYEEAMELEGQNVVKPIGIARTDVFYDEEYLKAARTRVEELVPAIKGKKVILYAPTFRGSTRKAAGPDQLDYEKLYEALGDEYVILTKHHPFVKNLPEIPEQLDGSFAFDITRSSDIQDLICVADICISDYSSLVYEYSLFEKPMIFFAYDLDDYCDWRGFYYDYDELTPGPVFDNTDDIVDYIKNIDERFDKQQVHDFREKFMCACDGHATDRIIDWMKSVKKNGGR